MDFFAEPVDEGTDSMDYDAGSGDLRSHLDARAGLNTGQEELFQDPVNVIHDIPVYPTAATPIPYLYAGNPIGIPDPAYQWWQHTPQYYPPPPMYQFQPPPQMYPQPTYAPMPNPSVVPPVGVPAMSDPELRRVQSERRPPRLGRRRRCTCVSLTKTPELSPEALHHARHPEEALSSAYGRPPASVWESEMRDDYLLIDLSDRRDPMRTLTDLQGRDDRSALRDENSRPLRSGPIDEVPWDSARSKRLARNSGQRSRLCHLAPSA
nr:uncharacterized protein LOC109155647 [Ipomoea batatas]